jgi:hypothetical protein
VTDSPRRLWGIDVIAGVWALSALLGVWLYLDGTEAGRFFGLVLVPFSAAISLGIAFRVDFVRRTLVVLLILTLAGEAVLLVYLLAAVAGLVEPPKRDPVRGLLQMPLRVLLTWTMLHYLRRPEVRAAFGRGTRYAGNATG